MKKGRIFFYNKIDKKNKKDLIKIRDDIRKIKIEEQKEDNSVTDDSNIMVLEPVLKPKLKKKPPKKLENVKLYKPTKVEIEQE